MITNLIKELQASGDKYTIMECGNGAAVTNLLMSVPGASSLLYECFQPYSKEAQEKLIGPFKRSVSIDTIIQAMKVIKGPCVVTQFQLQDEDSKVLTHGYIGVRGKNGERIYHISNYKNNYSNEEDKWEDNTYLEITNRQNQFNLISEIAVKIMYVHSVDLEYELSNLWIDGIFYTSGYYDEHETLRILGNCNEIDTMIPHLTFLKWARFEDLARDREGLIIMRGSFNPVHHSHIEMVKETIKLYPNYSPIFLISLHNRDKDNVNPKDAIERAYKLNKLGYNVVFSSLPLFNDLLNTIRNRWPNLPIILPVGVDTANRFLEDIVKKEEDLHNGLEKLVKKDGKLTSEPFPKWTVENLDKTAFRIFNGKLWHNAKLFIFERQGYKLSEFAKYFSDLFEINSTYKDVDGISSTKIRNGTQQNKI
ncbi:MAG: hypothetical protein ABIP51_11720 [Bacteroidia bacterium]